jgi:hypothetical protein
MEDLADQWYESRKENIELKNEISYISFLNKALTIYAIVITLIAVIA